jgi:hypothetical protein
MQGRSLVPLLKGESPTDWRKSMYYHYYEYPSVPQSPRALRVRTDRYKLISYYTSTSGNCSTSRPTRRR